MFKYQQQPQRYNVKAYWKKLVNGLMSKDSSNIMEATSTARMLCRYGGVSIYDYTVQPSNVINSSINYVGLTISVIWSTLYTWCTVYANINQQTILGIFYKTKMKYYGELCTAILSYIFVIYATTVLSISEAHKSQFWEEILKLDSSFADLGMKINFVKYQIHLLKVIVGVILIESFKISGIYFTFISWKLEMPLCKVFHMGCTFHIMMFSLIQYYFCLILLAKRYGIINTILQEAINIKVHTVNRITTVAKETNVSQGRFHDSSAHYETRALDKINAASKLYAEIYAIGGANDTRFGKVIVMMIFVNFISIILSMFSLMEATAGGLYSDITRYTFFFIYNFQEIVVGIFVIFLIVYASEKVYSEAKRTANIAHEIINQRISKNITKMATCLSMQLLHQQQTFSACGLFKLDRSLLLSVLSSITTYLIILLQFATGTTIEDMFDQAQEANATMSV